MAGPIEARLPSLRVNSVALLHPRVRLVRTFPELVGTDDRRQAPTAILCCFYRFTRGQSLPVLMAALATRDD